MKEIFCSYGYSYSLCKIYVLPSKVNSYAEFRLFLKWLAWLMQNWLIRTTIFYNLIILIENFDKLQLPQSSKFFANVCTFPT